MNMTNTPTYIYDELKRRNIPVEIVYEKAVLMRYYHNGKWRLLKGCLTEDASMIGCNICNNKTLSEMFARDAGLPVPKSVRYQTDEQALDFIAQHGPVAVKPLNAAHGHGISLNVKSKSALTKARSVAGKYSKAAPVLQQMVRGDDLRILLIGGKYTAAVRRVPATVVGDGQHTIRQLIEIENTKPPRTTEKRGELSVIRIKAAEAYLKRRIDHVPKAGQAVPVVGVSNTSVGGHGEDATDDVPIDIRKKVEAFVQKLQLPVCGVDIMMEQNGDYHFIEANASPGFGPHHHPRVGKRRDVTKLFVDYILHHDNTRE